MYSLLILEVSAHKSEKVLGRTTCARVILKLGTSNMNVPLIVDCPHRYKISLMRGDVCNCVEIVYDMALFGHKIKGTGSAQTSLETSCCTVRSSSALGHLKISPTLKSHTWFVCVAASSPEPFLQRLISTRCTTRITTKQRLTCTHYRRSSCRSRAHHFVCGLRLDVIAIAHDNPSGRQVSYTPGGIYRNCIHVCSECTSPPSFGLRRPCFFVLF